MIEQVKDIQIKCGLQQLVTDNTRYQIVGSVIQKSGLDHIYTNCPQKFCDPEIISVGDSDHKCVIARKYTTLPATHPRTYRIRQYTDIGIANYLKSILDNNVSRLVTNCTDLSE